ncbi:MAG TPA: diiron oxygenase [Streptosporangiaceae bacterium]|nr:diiron oxygenase [Streptosporangiaceae bacterium]
MRSKPRRELAEEPRQGSLFFPPEQVPVAVHARVKDLPRADELPVHALYQYLHLTTVLEQTTVVPVASQIASGQSNIELPAAFRADAFKICTDEAWHAQFSYDFMSNVAAVTGIEPMALVTPGYTRKVSQVREMLDPSLRPLLDIFFAVVTETLISRLLSDIPKDRRLVPEVCQIVADHAEDEGRHHAYFRSLLRYLWAGLSATERRQVGVQVPVLARAFLEPDIEAATRMLHAIETPAGDINSIISDSYPALDEHGFVRAAAGTVRAFRDAGAFEDSQIAEAFARAGLYTTPG